MNAATRPEQALEAIIGHEPTPEEMSNFYRVKEALDLSDNDAIWTVLLALGHYEILYKAVPTQIKQDILGIIAEHRAALETAAVAAQREVRNNVAADTAETVRKLVEQVNAGAAEIDRASRKKRLTIYAALSVGVAALAIVGAIAAGVWIGRAAQSADAVWLESPAGRAARTFAEINNVEQIMHCPPPHSIQQRDGNTYCLPYDHQSKRVTMWRIK